MNLLNFSPKLMINLILFLLISLPGQTSDHPVFQTVLDQFENGMILEAEMDHIFRDSFTGEESYNSGTILIGKNSYFISVEDQRVYVDGEISRVYNSRENKVIISNYSPDDDDFAPSRFFAQPADAYSITEETREDGTVRVTLSTNDPFEMFQVVTITLGSNGIPLEVHAVDQTDNIFTTIFESASFISETDDTFTFTYPESAEIIDLRE